MAPTAASAHEQLLLADGVPTSRLPLYERSVFAYDTTAAADCGMGAALCEALGQADLGGLFGFQSEVDASTLMSLLDADGNSEISWQEWSHACSVWLAEVSGQ